MDLQVGLPRYIRKRVKDIRAVSLVVPEPAREDGQPLFSGFLVTQEPDQEAPGSESYEGSFIQLDHRALRKFCCMVSAGGWIYGR